ncbi:hypothetical protein SCOR_33680 [Sulfidibacter corallicola]
MMMRSSMNQTGSPAPPACRASPQIDLDRPISRFPFRMNRRAEEESPIMTTSDPREDTGSSPDDAAGPDLSSPRVQALLDRYWHRNLRWMGVLLCVWLVVGLGCGILFADVLNQFRLFGYPLGFWFAQQGSIMTFVVLILIYCLVMNRLDAQHHRDLQRLKKESR